MLGDLTDIMISQYMSDSFMSTEPSIGVDVLQYIFRFTFGVFLPGIYITMTVTCS